jgi:hypothetical protein
MTRYAANAIERGDARSLYDVIEERARHALISIVKDRQRARALIERSYPPEEHEAALARLGDGAEVTDAAGLFARRCGRPCMGEIGATLGSVASVRREGDEQIVATTRGTTFRVYRRGDHGWYGIVWRTRELDAERAHANRDLTIVRDNAAFYDRQRALATPTLR